MRGPLTVIKISVQAAARRGTAPGTLMVLVDEQIDRAQQLLNELAQQPCED